MKELFSKKHYEALAKVCWEHDLGGWTISKLADMLKEDSPRFNREKFLAKANGMDEEGGEK